MPTEVYLVKVGMNMTEGVVEEWYVADGQPVNKGELLYRLETEKVNLDVDAETSGVVKHLVAEGITRAPGDLVGYIYASGEEIPGGTVNTGRIRVSPVARRLAADRGLDLSTISGTGPHGRIVEADVLSAEPLPESLPVSSPATSPPTSSPTSSPMARKLARELGVSLDGISGSGPGGRITREDVEALVADKKVATEKVAAESAPTSGRPDQEIPLRGMRRTIATRMHESLQTMAQLTMDMDVRMDDAIKLRSQLIVEWAEKEVRPTYTDLVVRAAAKALANHPQMNAQLTDNAVVLKGQVNVGMAVALSEGLIVPVIRSADRLSLEEIARATSALAAKARDSALTPDELQDGTFTVTALGMYGVDAFTPIINAPQAGILGVNRIRDDTLWEDGTPRRVQVMRLSLTWDHRVLDGAPAARFLGEVRELLESPYRLLV